MELREYGNYLIATLTEEDDKGEFVAKVAEMIKTEGKQHLTVIVSLEETPDQVIERMTSVNATVDCNLDRVDIEDILAFGRRVHGGTHRVTVGGLGGDYDGCRWNYPTKRILSRPKDPTKGLAGMPLKHGKGRHR